MVQPNYSPKEALNRVKLMMGYDPSKTLTENVNSVKKPIMEQSGIYGRVKKILDACDAGLPSDQSARYMKQPEVDNLAGQFNTAFSSAFGTDNDLWKKALGIMKAKGGYADLCAIAKSYEDQSGESFIEGIDADIDYDSEWTQFVSAFTTMVNRTKEGGLKTKEAESQTIDSWETKFPCIFKTNSNLDQEVRKDNNQYTYILIKTTSGKNLSLFWDGRLKTQDQKLLGKKLVCSGDKPSIIAESEKKKVIEQVDDSSIWGQGNTPPPNPTPRPPKPPKPKVQYRACSGGYSEGCKSEVIKKVQACLGFAENSQTGNYGPKTKAALKAKGFTSFTDADVDKICGTKKVEEPEVGGEVKIINPNDL